eukprot:TRINITY_DN1498_c0_g1_i11.p1 TRINITY_DN1498_c0_g1~~TRINITY_DN1498_c0_g1_i11.p1  ORF type:complete len:162 (-),score=15.84 TRINITY_DN1498_c0_g1_i11:651-1136(-)
MQGVTQVPTSTPGGGYGSMGTSPPPLSGDANPPAYFAAAIDARQVMQRRCARCKQYYTNSDADPTCWFHPGHFVEHKSVMQGASVGWSCCRSLPEWRWGTEEKQKRKKKLQTQTTPLLQVCRRQRENPEARGHQQALQGLQKSHKPRGGQVVQHHRRLLPV